MTVDRKAPDYLQVLVANSEFNKALDLMTREPRRLSVLSRGHYEGRSIYRGPVANESVLALAFAKGYTHANTWYLGHRLFSCMPCIPTMKKIIDRIFALQDENPGLDIGLNTRDTLGNTPLHIAAMHRDAGLMRKLLERGADINIRNINGHTPLNILTETGIYHYQEVIAILAQYTGTSDYSREKKDYHTFTLVNQCKWGSRTKGCIKVLRDAPHREPESEPGSSLMSESKHDRMSP
ncbi:MAG: ankyrin repeat domain-containing protein [Coxiellaceae bacterium]|nr:ankyrin repeat domain-containing protein [Coxiellaceae bacterium]